MPSSWLWHQVHLVWTDVLEERIASIFRMQPPAHTGSRLADFCSLKMKAVRSNEMSVHTRFTWCYILEDCVLHSHHHVNLKSYKKFKTTIRSIRFKALQLPLCYAWEASNSYAGWRWGLQAKFKLRICSCESQLWISSQSCQHLGCRASDSGMTDE